LSRTSAETAHQGPCLSLRGSDVPGLYLLAILVSAAGIGVIDARWHLVMWRSPLRSLGAVVVGTLFFLAWDAVGIATGVFVKGGSPLFVGIDLAPQLPLEEIFFLAFLCYTGLVVWAAALRVIQRRIGSDDESPAVREEQP
jgi:lycopene cyclase domain-containing protein